MVLLLQLKNKKLFYFIPLNYHECMKKGNYTYLRCYETYFDKNYIIYFNSEKKAIYRKGRTIYIGVGGSKYGFLNVLKSPIVLLKLLKKTKPNVCITTDWLYSFWSALLIRLKKEYIFYPVCYVGDILKNPIPNNLRCKVIENAIIKLSLLFVPKIHVVKSQIMYDKFWETSKLTKKKLIHAELTVEEFPTIEFLEKAALVNGIPQVFIQQDRSYLKLITISRLYKDKMLGDYLEAVKILKSKGMKVILYIFGDGPEKEFLKQQVKNLEIEENIKFMGSVSNESLVPYLQNADLYVSTFTGTSLREAIICNLPVVTYKHPMTQMYFDSYGTIGYITDENTPMKLANSVERYLRDQDKHEEIKNNIKTLQRRWSLEELARSLEKTFSYQ
jgi:glycosyltransferase involved in cell wall biosynthesis